MECATHACALDNALWGRALAGTLWRLGCRQVVASPGLRALPVTFALAHAQGYAETPNAKGLEVIPVLDERSAAFFALGLAKQTHTPVGLICTSGSAAANFLPALAEASQSRVPLFVITTDRPPELQQCWARQTLPQEGLYKNFVARSQTLPLPEAACLPALRSALVASWSLCIQEQRPVHLNVPMREPLLEAQAWDAAQEVDLNDHWSAVAPPIHTTLQPPPNSLFELLQTWKACKRGLIVVGPHNPQDPDAFCTHIAQLSKTLGWPLIVDALGPLRFRGLQHVISSADKALKDTSLWESLRPQAVLAIGPPTVARSIRTFLEQAPAERTWAWSPHPGLEDPLHRGASPLSLSLESLSNATHGLPPSPPCAFAQKWLDLEASTCQSLQAQHASKEAFEEATLPALLQKLLPDGTPLFIANSLCVRHFNTYTRPCASHWLPYCSRGIDGIDGTLSTALGIAHRNHPTVLLTGDLAFLHDTNGLLLAPELHGSLTVLIVDNKGGQIFKTLPAGQVQPEWLQRYTITPQQVHIHALAQAYGISYGAPSCVSALSMHLERTLHTPGVHLLHLQFEHY